MINHGKHNVLGVRIDAVDYEAAVSEVIAAAKERRPLAVSPLAVHGVMTGALNAAHRYRLNRLDIACPDGQPVRWALRLLHGVRLPDRVYGPNLMLEVCRAAAEHGLPVFFLGGDAHLLSALEDRLCQRFPALQVAGRRESRFRRLEPDEWQKMVHEVEASGARILFVGLGCPRQEVFAFEFRGFATMPTLAVGAAFSFHSGRLPQAPTIMQRWGLEWLYRMMHEPRRLWRRYLLLNPAYVVLLALQALGVRRFEPDLARPPESPVFYG